MKTIVSNADDHPTFRAEIRVDWEYVDIGIGKTFKTSRRVDPQSLNFIEISFRGRTF